MMFVYFFSFFVVLHADVPFTFTFPGKPTIIPFPSPKDKFPVYFPDAQIAITVESNADETMFWSDGCKNMRSEGPTLDQQAPDPLWNILNCSKDTDAPDVSGDWLLEVFRFKKDEPRLFGFVHDENHYFNGTVPPSGPGHKEWYASTYVMSEDDGRSWEKIGEILSEPKPYNVPAHNGGIGVNTVVRSRDGKGFFGYGPCQAFRSYDDFGRPGTWYRWFNGSFGVPGVLTDPKEVARYHTIENGRMLKCLPGMKNDMKYGTTTVTFNEYLGLYLMVKQRWGNNNLAYLRYSYDAIHWEPEAYIPMIWNQTEPGNDVAHYGYPQLLHQRNGESNQENYLLYYRTPTVDPKKYRDFIHRKTIFQKLPGYQAFYERLRKKYGKSQKIVK